MNINRLLKDIDIVREHQDTINTVWENQDAIDEALDSESSIDKQIHKYKKELVDFGVSEKQLNPFCELAALSINDKNLSPLRKFEQLRESLIELAQPSLTSTKALQKMMTDILDHQKKERQGLYGKFLAGFESPDLVNLFPKINNPFEQYLAQQKVILEKFKLNALSPFSTITKFDFNKSLVEALGGIHTPHPIIEEIARFHRQYAEPEDEQSPVWGNINGLVNSYFTQLSREFESGVTENSSDQSLQKLNQLIQKQLNDPRQTTFSKLEIITIIIYLLTLLTTFYQAYLAHGSGIEQTQQKEQIENLFKSLIKYSEDELEQTGELQFSTFYFVERPVYLKTSQSSKSGRIYLLIPETKVKLLVKNHKWLFVEALDSVNAIPVRGWVEKKYLKRIKR